MSGNARFWPLIAAMAAREANPHEEERKAYKRVFKGITGALHGQNMLGIPFHRGRPNNKQFQPWVQRNRGRSKAWLEEMLAREYRCEF